MDLPFSPTTTSDLNRKRKSEESTNVPSKRFRFYQTYSQQQFSFPNSIVYYITMIPRTPKVYQKLIQTCKYFFHKNPILVISELYYSINGWATYVNGQRKDIDMNNISSKCWITNKLFVNPINAENKTLVSSVLPKIFRCDANYLCFSNQIVYLDQLMFLAPNVRIFSLNYNILKHENGIIIPPEKIVQLFSTLEDFCFTDLPKAPSITSKTFIKLIKIPRFLAFSYFCLWDVPEDFDFECFYTYMKINKYTQFELSFADTISEGYKSRLDSVIDEIIGTKNLKYKPPLIRFYGIDGKKLDKLEEIFYSQ